MLGRGILWSDVHTKGKHLKFIVQPEKAIEGETAKERFEKGSSGYNIEDGLESVCLEEGERLRDLISRCKLKLQI